MPSKDLSLVIACYMDEPHILRNVQQLAAYLSGTRLAYEMVFVEDFSPDNTADEVRKCVAWLEKNSITAKAIYHQSNTGRGKSVSDGIKASEGSVVGYIDIDLEHPMDGIFPMVQMILSGSADVVVGRRALGKPHAKPVRVICSYAYRWFAHLVLPLPIADTECGFKFFDRRKILPVLETVKDPRWFWDTEIVHRAWIAGLRVSERWVVFVEDKRKASTVHLVRDTWRYLEAICAYRKRLYHESRAKFREEKLMGCS